MKFHVISAEDEYWRFGTEVETGLGMRFPPAYAGMILTVFDKDSEGYGPV